MRLVKISQQNGKTREEVHAMAQAVEHLLFQNSTSFQRYGDVSTLDARLRSILTAKVHRRLVQHSIQGDHRSQVLHKILGSERYNQTRLLIRDIRDEKNKLGSTQLTCSPGTCCTGTARLLSFHVQMPKPVKEIVFGATPLLDAFEKSPVDTLHRLEWNTLISNGRTSLEVYRKWQRERFGTQDIETKTSTAKPENGSQNRGEEAELLL
jgi:hypothetical protein